MCLPFGFNLAGGRSHVIDLTITCDRRNFCVEIAIFCEIFHPKFFGFTKFLYFCVVNVYIYSMKVPVFYDNRIASVGRCMDVCLNFLTLVDSLVPEDDDLRKVALECCDNIVGRCRQTVSLPSFVDD